jgi:hypothetical protein
LTKTEVKQIQLILAPNSQRGHKPTKEFRPLKNVITNFLIKLIYNFKEFKFILECLKSFIKRRQIFLTHKKEVIFVADFQKQPGV